MWVLNPGHYLSRNKQRQATLSHVMPTLDIFVPLPYTSLSSTIYRAKSPLGSVHRPGHPTTSTTQIEMRLFNHV